MFARAKNYWDKKICPAFRDARNRAGDITAFIFTLGGVYKIPLKPVGGILAGVTGAIPLIFFYKNMKESMQDNRVIPYSTQEIQRQLQHNPALKYLDCFIAFLGQFGMNHMEMMIAAASSDEVEFVDYETLTHPKNFLMLLYVGWALYHSAHAFHERKLSYEKLISAPQTLFSAAAETRIEIQPEVKIDLRP